YIDTGGRPAPYVGKISILSVRNAIFSKKSRSEPPGRRLFGARGVPSGSGRDFRGKGDFRAVRKPPGSRHPPIRTARRRRIHHGGTETRRLFCFSSVSPCLRGEKSLA